MQQNKITKTIGEFQKFLENDKQNRLMPGRYFKVLFDSWFFSKEILARIESLSSRSIKLIAIVRMSGIIYLDCLIDQHKQASELGKPYRKKARRNRKYIARYIKVPVWYNNSRLNLFFVRLGFREETSCMIVQCRYNVLHNNIIQ